jgi:NAD+ diphosphatase
MSRSFLPFTGNPLDRASEWRGNSAWLAEQRARSDARVLPFLDLQPLLIGPESGEQTRLGFLTGAQAARFGAPDAQEVFLGLEDGIAHFACDISGFAAARAALDDIGHFREARGASARIPFGEIAILGQAKALLDWHARHGFCARCGVATHSQDGGYRRHCGSCGSDHFPRTDPAVIMLVTDGDRCLLARNRRFATGNVHSTLAGFVEPGESIEEAVRREVMEEVGIRTGAVRYFASQPWPFPSSLMIGCYAEAESRDIRIDGIEIVAARWMGRALVRRMIAGEDSADIALPRREAIAFHLIRNWAEE